jgi:hypothetical protein
VQILGGGAAALAAAQALAYHGIEASLATGPTKSGPDLLLNWPTVHLLQDLFGCKAALLTYGWMIRGRLISWGRDSPESEHVEEPGLTIAASMLHRILRDALASGDGKDAVCIGEAHNDGLNGDIGWTVEARGKSAGSTDDVATIGERAAICGHFRLSGAADPSLCALEAVEHGWLFLLPLGGTRAAVQAIVPQMPENADRAIYALLAQSRLIARFVAESDGETHVFACAPRFRSEPARSTWLAAGDAALSFDPLCGDGTGQALRCGLLAAAVIAAIKQGEPEEGCLTHYRYRLRRAMLAHLKATIAYYEIAVCRDVWRRDIEMAGQALDYIACGVPAVGSAKRASYRLQRFSLVRA